MNRIKEGKKIFVETIINHAWNFLKDILTRHMTNEWNKLKLTLLRHCVYRNKVALHQRGFGDCSGGLQALGKLYLKMTLAQLKMFKPESSCKSHLLLQKPLRLRTPH